MADTTNADVWPDPPLDAWQMWAVYPYLLSSRLDTRRGKTAEARYREWVRHPVETSGTARGAWRLTAPRDLRRAELDRWFPREVRCLFFDDDDARAMDEDRIVPKFRWFHYDGPKGKERDEATGLPVFADHRIGVVRAAKRSPTGTEVQIFPVEVKAEAFVLVSDVGAALLVVHLRYRPKQRTKVPLRLSDGMYLNELAAYSDGSPQALVFVPKSIVRELAQAEEARVGERPDLSAPVPLSETQAAHCLPLWTATASARVPTRFPKLATPLPELLRGSLLPRIEGLDCYLGSHGRVPLASQFVLPADPCFAAASGDDPDESRRYAQLEWLAVRDHLHPAQRTIHPLTIDELQDEELRSVPVTGSQRFHATCEGFTAWGFGCTEFDRTTWPGRVGGEYLLTFLIALHQAVVLQDLSWRSYTRRSRRDAEARRDNEALVRRYLEFNTEYDFSSISPQMNIQRLYRAARTALGVPRLAQEVRDEIGAWLENEGRKEQRTLNSVAVVALLASLATALIGLDLAYFTNDSHVVLWWDETRPSGLFWFWLPASIAAVLAIASRTMRGHVGRVADLLVERRRERRRGRRRRT